jgi:hypothetical protein
MCRAFVFGSSSDVSMCCVVSERVVVNLLRFAARPDHSDRTTPHLIRLLSLLSSVPASVLAAFGQRITSGVMIFLETHAEHIREPMGWQVVMRVLLHFVHHPRAATQAFASLCYVLEQHLTFANYSALLSALLAFTTPSAVRTPPLAHTRSARNLMSYLCMSA